MSIRNWTDVRTIENGRINWSVRAAFFVSSAICVGRIPDISGNAVYGEFVEGERERRAKLEA